MEGFQTEPVSQGFPGQISHVKDLQITHVVIQIVDRGAEHGGINGFRQIFLIFSEVRLQKLADLFPGPAEIVDVDVDQGVKSQAERPLSVV